MARRVGDQGFRVALYSQGAKEIRGSRGMGVDVLGCANGGTSDTEGMVERREQVTGATDVGEGEETRGKVWRAGASMRASWRWH